MKDEEVYSLYSFINNSSNELTQSENKIPIKEVLLVLEDKFLKLKDNLIKRQLNESDSLYAVQRMDWQSKIKFVANVKLINVKYDDAHVPIVIVNNKLELTSGLAIYSGL